MVEDRRSQVERRSLGKAYLFASRGLDEKTALILTSVAGASRR